ncbi:membrane protein [Xenorhabdus beddingii]|uniref:Membrane protein n=1 Tax=Xenorhabdus beddingii TaxID=40578 RepID=A0A1Y2STU6_9GAMM|nr:BPSS1780 family membrane protein [Xenorhabdus beddingii]OTA21648.1 membrane protein [Xenorhabdus beddingii]
MDIQDTNLDSGEKNVSLAKEKSTFIPGGRSVGAGAATEWIGSAWGMFKANPMRWILITLIYIAIIAITVFIPFLGIFSMLFGPVFVAGFIAAGEKQRTTGNFDIELIFYGFKNKLGSLVAVGALFFGIYLLGVIAAMIVGGAGLFQLILSGQSSDPALLLGSLSTLFLSILILYFFMTVGLAFSWFAPALIIINDLKFGEAVSMSLSAVKKNLFGGFLFFLLMGIMMSISAIPLGLGLFVMIPLYMATYYTTYRSIFYTTESQESKSDLIS